MMLAEIPCPSPLYDACKRLRQEVLRTPLGLALSEKDVEGEETQMHIAAQDEAGNVTGCVILKPLSTDTVKLRQMAVAAAWQGKGLGRDIVRFAETLAGARGFAAIELHARVYAQSFYEKLGYAAMGAIFTEATLPTIKMTKDL